MLSQRSMMLCIYYGFQLLCVACKDAGIASLRHMGHGFLKFSLILLNSKRIRCGKVM